jgi:hypothetical protein
VIASFALARHVGGDVHVPSFPVTVERAEALLALAASAAVVTLVTILVIGRPHENLRLARQ